VGTRFGLPVYATSLYPSDYVEPVFLVDGVERPFNSPDSLVEVEVVIQFLVIDDNFSFAFTKSNSGGSGFSPACSQIYGVVAHGQKLIIARLAPVLRADGLAQHRL